MLKIAGTLFDVCFDLYLFWKYGARWFDRLCQLCGMALAGWVFAMILAGLFQ